ncbi:MAG: sialidase family protein, partial [Isosphaeraceae bacterium]
LVVPVASTGDDFKENRFTAWCYLSDDEGQTWRRSRTGVPYARRGAMEPEVVELSGGTLLMHFRTQLGHIAVSRSFDGGETWTEGASWGVRSPEAPATLRRIPSTGDLLLIWNDTYREGEGHGGKRTPLTAAISTDEGRTWSHRRDIETSEKHTYAYTSVLFDRGRALLSYYVRDESNGEISTRFRSIPIGWFYDAPKGP